MNLIQDLADECVREDVGYDPLPQHVYVWLVENRDNVTTHDELAEHLANVEIKAANTPYSLWQILAPEAMRTDDLSADAMVATIRREAFAWATTKLCEEVDAAIDAKLAAYIPEDETEFVDEYGGAL